MIVDLAEINWKIYEFISDGLVEKGWDTKQKMTAEKVTRLNQSGIKAIHYYGMLVGILENIVDME